MICTGGQTGDTAPRAQRNQVPLRLKVYREAILAHVAKHPDATMVELREWLPAEHGVAVCPVTIWKTPDHSELPSKKSRSGRPSEIV